MLIKNQVAGSALNQQPLTSLQSAAATPKSTALSATNSPSTNSFAVLRGTSGDLLLGTTAATDGKPPVAPDAGKGTPSASEHTTVVQSILNFVGAVVGAVQTLGGDGGCGPLTPETALCHARNLT